MNPRPSRPERDALPAALRLDFFNFLSIFVSGQTCGQATYFERFVEKYTARIVRFFKGFSDFKKSLLQDRWRCPERCALPAALRLDFSVFIYFRKWSNMWSSHLFRTFCGKVYRPNCQVLQGVQRFEKNYQEKPLWVSRTLRATSCATPRFIERITL